MKNIKWITLSFVFLFVIFTPMITQAGDDDEREYHGTVISRPDGKVGVWVIGDKSVEVSRRTEFKQENGPLDVGACAKVKYLERDGKNRATRLKSEESEKCRQDEDRDNDNDSGDNGGGGDPPTTQNDYIVVGWNDLGMHCMDPSFEDFAVLPPYNTLWAQVIKRGSEPEIVTQGVTVEYSIIDNTDSTSKTNFWDINPNSGMQYAQELFGLPAPLPDNVGLAGFGLSGEMHTDDDHFVAEGVPLTEYRDSDPTTPYPYQLAELVAKDSNGNVLATTQTVAPVSTEMNCQNCHDNNGTANPDIATGSLKQNILTLHDQQEGTNLMDQRPVLCASCHGSNALGTPGEAGVPNLSLAMHDKHEPIDDFTQEGTCYQCHPGPKTSCLRGTMAEDGMTCQDCHGNMADVADPARQPWLDEPRCGDCHEGHAEEPGMLYRFSTGHGGVYCQACHGSQHAVYPTNQHNDNIQSIMLQGEAGTLEKCTVCHTSTPGSEGPHGERAESQMSDFTVVNSSGDVNGDGTIDILDMVTITASFGTSDTTADINSDGTVDILDVVTAANNFLAQ
jgi:hypothetical protein